MGLGEIKYFNSIGSTNDEALAWANKGAPDFSVVIADEQTMGRGRMDRPWFTPAGTALAFSVILMTLVTDLVVAWLDPRIKLHAGSA